MTNDFYCEQVLSGRTPVEKVLETERVLAYKHTRPHWPVHIVVIPKQHIASLLDLEDETLLVELIGVVKQVASLVIEQEGACRIVTNLGEYQESKHLHWHVGAGKVMATPPTV